MSATIFSLVEEDFRVFDHGSIIALRPISELARAWVESYIDPDAMWHGSAVCIERRYFEPIMDGIIADGLTLA